MIIRSWRAVAGTDEVLDAYARHLKTTTFVEMAALPGHIGATLARKVKGSQNELVVISLWEDMASANHFIKGNFDDAVVKPSTQTLLQSFDLKVEFFETLVSTGIIAGHSAAGRPGGRPGAPEAAVGQDGDLDVIAVAGQGLVDGVVDDLPDHVVQAAGSGRTDVHTGAQSNGLETLEDRNLLGAIRRSLSRLGRLGLCHVVLLRVLPLNVRAPPENAPTTLVNPRSGTALALTVYL